MPKSLIAALVLVACSFGNEVFAQSPESPDNTGGAKEAPTLILPGTLTSPITSGLDSEGRGGAGAPEGTETPDATSKTPYSVEGEETFDPDTN